MNRYPVSLFIILLNVEHSVLCTEPDEAGQHFVTTQDVKFFCLINAPKTALQIFQSRKNQ